MKKFMKKFTIIAAILLTSNILFAQSIEITPLFGYTLSGKVNGYNTTYDVKDDMMYGGLLDVEIDHLLHVELSYRRSDPRMLEIKYPSGIIARNHDIGIEHYQVGVIREFMEGKVKPFGGISLGTSRYFGKDTNSRSYWYFSGAVELGAKLFITDNIGIRLQTNLTMPLEFGGGGIFCGIGGGSSSCGTNVYFNVPIVHLDLTAGLIIRLPN